MRIPVLGAVLAALAVGQGAPDPFLMERLLPQDALLYVSVPQSASLAEDYKKSHLARLVDHPEIRAFTAPVEAWWKKRKNEATATGPSWNEMVRESAGLTIDEIRDLLQGPLSFAVYDVPLNEERKLDLVLSAGADTAKLRRAAESFKAALKRQGAELQESEYQHRGTTVYGLGMGDFRFFYAVVERTFVFATLQQRLEGIIAAAADRTFAGLREDPKFKSARARVAPENRHLLLAWLNVSGILKGFRREIGDEALQVLEALGVSDITGAAAAVAYDGPQLRERYALATARQTRGMLKFLSGGTPLDASAALVPAGSLSYAHFGFNLAELYDVALEAAKANPDAEREFREALRRYEERSGVRVRESLATVGTSWTSYSMLPAAGGALPDSVYVVSLSDPARFQDALEKVLRDADLKIEKLSYRGQEIRWFTIGLADLFRNLGPLGGGIEFGYSPAFFIRDHRLFLSIDPLSLKRQVDRLGQKTAPIADDPKWKALASKVRPEEWESWSYIDIGRVFNIGYSSLEPFAHVFRDLPRDDEGELVVDLAKLPLGETVAELLGPTLTTKRTFPDAIVVDTASSTGIGSTSGLVTLGLVAAVGIPFVARGGGGGLAENERVAELTLQFIRQSQSTFKNSDSDRNGVGDYWTRDVAGLYGLKDRSGQAIFLIDPATAGADPEGAARYNLPASPKSGYFFKALASDPDGQPYAKDEDKDGNAFTNKARWGVVAYPAGYGATGRFTFIAGEEGKIWKKDTQGRPVDRWPGKDPAEQGWAPLE